MEPKAIRKKTREALSTGSKSCWDNAVWAAANLRREASVIVSTGRGSKTLLTKLSQFGLLECIGYQSCHALGGDIGNFFLPARYSGYFGRIICCLVFTGALVFAGQAEFEWTYPAA